MHLFFLLPWALPSLAQIDPFPDSSQQSVLDYSPRTKQRCPSDADTFVREFTPGTQSLHPSEIEYIRTREESVISQEWVEWIGAENGAEEIGYGPDEDLVRMFGQRWPRVGMAITGGGLRAAQYGAGVVNALDKRNDTSREMGTGGLMQVVSYMSGLSGGSWVTGSLFFNDWPTIRDLVFGDGKDLGGWLLDLPFASPDGLNVLTDENQAFYGSLLWSVMAKAESGIDTSMTDTWARMISYHFLNQTSRANFFTNDTAHGAGQLWSRIPDIPAFRSHLSPLPLAVACSRPVGSNLTTVLGLEPVVYEISPFEFGSFDPVLSAMMSTKYAGTHMRDKKPENMDECVTGFDQAGFVMGTSASLFNQIFDFAHNTLEMRRDDVDTMIYLLQRQLRSVRTRADDVANWPSPFTGLKPDSFEDSSATWLEMIDGASALENIPLSPMLVNARGIDTIVVVEGSADSLDNWPNGTSILKSQERQQLFLRASHRTLPPMPPTTADFENTGVSSRATFFGCDPTLSPPEWPLVIYLPNQPPLDGTDPVSNSPTFRLVYTLKHTQRFIDQVHAAITSGFTPSSNDPDADFGVCLKCAALDRGRLPLRFADALNSTSSNSTTARPQAIPRSVKCQQCFDRYCYDPSRPPSARDLPPGRKYAFVDPDPQGFDRLTGFLDRAKFGLVGALVGLMVFVGVLIAFLLWWRKRREKEYEYMLVNQLHERDGEAPWIGMAEAQREHQESQGQGVYEMPAFRDR